MKRLAACAVALLSVLCTSPARARMNSAALYTDQSLLEFRLEAPLQKLFAARADETFHVPGTITYAQRGSGQFAVPGIEVSVRGHTSRQEEECTFPKLKLKFPKDGVPNGSVFAGTTSIKVGTHCGEAPDGQFTPKFGRLANEHSPLREALVYRLIEAAAIPTLKTRPARITYVDPDVPTSAPLVRYALLLEDDSDARARLGAADDIPVGKFGSAQERFSPTDTARLAFGEAMIGNFDWCLKFTPADTYRCDAPTPLWNVVALERADGRAIPMIHDFDLAGMVTGRHPWFDTVYFGGFVPSRSAVEIEVLSQVQRTRSLFPRAVLDEARRAFMGRKASLSTVLSQTSLDTAGRTMAREYLNAFFGAIGSDAAFYRRVVAASGVRLYADSARTQEACTPGDTIPQGTPVNELRRDGGMLQVQVLDVLWHWAPPARCDAVHKDAVWIDASAVTADYPK